MRKKCLVILLALALLAIAVTPVLADSPTPGGGAAFGEHVAGMAPEHPLTFGGQAFGDCVSNMASGLECPHTH